MATESNPTVTAPAPKPKAGSLVKFRVRFLRAGQWGAWSNGQDSRKRVGTLLTTLELNRHLTPFEYEELTDSPV